MAKPLITEVTTSQTFENWLAKTNEMVGIFKDEVMTASGSGDEEAQNEFLILPSDWAVVGDIFKKTFALGLAGGEFDVIDKFEE